jgi:RNA polymerase sigma factor for flagellar operon FliA
MDTSRSKATDIWDRYHRTRDEELRNELVIAYLPLVRYVAGRLRQQLPAFVDVEDLASYGVFGLVDAIDRYDPAWGTKFETFGAPRIRGAILDELRALDWAPRSVRSAARGVERGVEDLRASLGREPGDGEIAAHMDVAVDEVRRARSNAASAVLDSLQPSFGSGLDAVDLQPAAAGSSDPATEAEVTVLHERLAQAAAWLPVEHRMVAWHYYVEGLRMWEIGERLGLGESKVCQLYTASALLLRERLAVLR